MIRTYERKKITFSFLFFLLFSFFYLASCFSQALKDEEKKAFEYLNEVRANPKIFSQEIGDDLSKVKPMSALKWNDTLAKVAEEKAMDMAKRNYFGHVTPDGKGINILIYEAGYEIPKEWFKNKNENYFESINAGTETGIGAIKELILDSYDSGKGHRKHLLGMNDFYSNLTDIGIGHIKSEGSKYTFYTVVIIAKHSW